VSSRKTRLVTWLEAETGKPLTTPATSNDRQVSIRVPVELYERIDAIARDCGETVSQTMRKLVAESIDRIDHPDAVAIDTAIAALQQLRRRRA
jgi:predicted DNA-binding protein